MAKPGVPPPLVDIDADNLPDAPPMVKCQQYQIGSRYAVPRPKHDEFGIALPPISPGVKRRGLPKNPPNAVPIYGWKHKIEADTRPFGPLLFERMPARYARKTKATDVDIMVTPEKVRSICVLSKDVTS